MKYKVKTDLLGEYDVGDKISESRKDRLVEDGCSEAWFERVDNVKKGDYLKHKGGVYRICHVSNVGNFPYEAELVAGEGRNTDGFRKTHEVEKISVDQIEQELIKEAKRRGFEAGVTANCSRLFKDGEEYSDHVLEEGRYLKYRPSKDELVWKVKREAWPVYKKKASGQRL